MGLDLSACLTNNRLIPLSKIKVAAVGIFFANAPDRDRQPVRNEPHLPKNEAMAGPGAVGWTNYNKAQTFFSS